MNFKAIIFIALVITIGGSFIVLKKLNISQRDPNIFIVGTTSGYAPFVSINFKVNMKDSILMWQICLRNRLAKN